MKCRKATARRFSCCKSVPNCCCPRNFALVLFALFYCDDWLGHADGGNCVSCSAGLNHPLRSDVCWFPRNVCRRPTHPSDFMRIPDQTSHVTSALLYIYLNSGPCWFSQIHCYFFFFFFPSRECKNQIFIGFQYSARLNKLVWNCFSIDCPWIQSNPFPTRCQDMHNTEAFFADCEQCRRATSSVPWWPVAQHGSVYESYAYYPRILKVLITKEGFKIIALTHAGGCIELYRWLSRYLLILCNVLKFETE